MIQYLNVMMVQRQMYSQIIYSNLIQRKYTFKKYLEMLSNGFFMFAKLFAQGKLFEYKYIIQFS